jgi:peptidoglycan hydrolase CwlO-like protein
LPGALAFANVVPAPQVATDPDCFRTELSGFVSDLAPLPQFTPAQIGETQDVVASLDPGNLQSLETSLAGIPGWRAMPRILVAVNAAEDSHRNELLARVIEHASDPSALVVTPEKEAEYFRRDFLFLVEQMGRYSDLMGPEFTARVENVRRAIEAMPADAIPALRDEYNRHAGDWQLLAAGVSQRTVGGNALRPIEALGCNWDCGIDVGCWISAVNCLIDEVRNLAAQIANKIQELADTIASVFTQVGNVFAQIAQLPATIANYFTGLFDQIKTLLTKAFNSLLALIPNSVEEVLAFLEDTLGYAITNFNWNDVASQAPMLPDLCPDDAAAIASEICDRGGDAITELVFNVVPEDGLSLAVKLGVAAIHFPLAYLCQCAEGQEAIEYAHAQADHRELTGDRLDLQLSTRAMQSSVDVLNSNLGDLDGDVGNVEAKLDVLEAKVDTLASLQNDAQLFIEDFRTLSTRLAIEANLLETKPDVVSQYQLPRAFGGMLETVGLIVADTIRINLLASQPIGGAERELQRGDLLIVAGDFVKAYEAYRSAYGEAVKP